MGVRVSVLSLQARYEVKKYEDVHPFIYSFIHPSQTP